MKTYTYLLLILSLAVTTPCDAAENTDSERIAAAIAPFLDEQAFLVAHVECGQLDVDGAVKSVGGLLGQHAAIVEEATKPHSSTVRKLREVGVHELYFVLSIADIPGGTGAFVVPVAEQAKADAVEDIFREFKEFHLQQIGSNVVLSDPKTLARLKDVVPESRPHLVNALAAVKDAPVKIVLTPPGYFRPVIEQMLPELPEVVGGGSSTVLTVGVQWAAVGIEFEPLPRIRVIVQSESPEAATAFAEKLGEASKLLAENKEARADLPSIDEVLSLLTPDVENDRVQLTVGVENGKLPKLIEFALPK